MRGRDYLTRLSDLTLLVLALLRELDGEERMGALALLDAIGAELQAELRRTSGMLLSTSAGTHR